MSGVTLAPQHNLNYINLKDYCKIDGSDDSVGFTTAYTLASTLGMGLRMPGGTLVKGNDTLLSNVPIDLGGGTIKLKNGANTDLFSAQTSSINLSASGGSGPAGTLYGFSIKNGTLDGNKANQTGGPSYPLRFYGCDYTLENLDVINGYTGDILSDWNAGNNWPVGAHSMEARWLNVKTTNSNGVGVAFGGPHDSQFINLIPYEEGTHCLQLGYNAYGSQFLHLHAWSPGQNDGLTIYGQDDFGRSNQSGLGTASGGLAWAEAPGSGNVTAAIASNQASFTGNGAEADSFFTLGSASVANIDIYERLNLGGDAGDNTVGIIFRYTDTSNYYRAVIAGNLLYLQKNVAGTKTTITSPAFSLANNTNAWMRVQASGTTLKVKIWLEGTAEPSAWNITQTDSSLSSGKFGIFAWINSSTATVDSFQATSPITTPLSVAVLNEAQGAVYFENCQAESSMSVQVVVLGSGFEWVGGNVFGDTPYITTGFQIGQQAGATPYVGQLRQSAGVTTAYNPTNCRINSRVSNVCGPQGAIWLANEGAGNVYDITDDQGKGETWVGTMHATTNARIIPYGLTVDGSRGKGGYFKFAGNSFNAMEIGDGTNVQFNANTNAGEYRWGNGAYVRLYSDSFSTPIVELGTGNAGAITLGNDSTTQIKHLATGIMAVTGAFATAESTSAAVTATSGTIATAGVGVARIAPTGNISSVILAVGTQPGQQVIVRNESAFTATFHATPATGHVAGGSAVVIAANRSQLFSWNNTAALWY